MTEYEGFSRCIRCLKQRNSLNTRVRSPPPFPSIIPKSEQIWYLVAIAELLNHIIDVSFYIIAYCTSREEKSGLRNSVTLRHARALQWRPKMIYLLYLLNKIYSKVEIENFIQSNHGDISDKVRRKMVTSPCLSNLCHQLQNYIALFFLFLFLLVICLFDFSVIEKTTKYHVCWNSGRISSFSEGMKIPPWDRSWRQSSEIIHWIILWD